MTTGLEANNTAYEYATFYDTFAKAVPPRITYPIVRGPRKRPSDLRVHGHDEMKLRGRTIGVKLPVAKKLTRCPGPHYERLWSSSQI